MEGNVCTSAACFLQQQGGLVSFPLVTIAGLVDGINPCAIGMILLLLGYLLVFAKKPEKVLPLGGVYILTIYFTYLLIGLFFFKTVRLLNLSDWRQGFEWAMTFTLFVAGAINIKDYFFPLTPLHLEIPQRARRHLFALIEKATLPAIIILAVAVTLLETPCSLPIYVGTATILSQAGLPPFGVLGYFLYYNFLFVLPLIVILFLVWKGKQIVELKKWEHKHKKTMKLSLGLLLVLISAYLFFF